MFSFDFTEAFDEADEEMVRLDELFKLPEPLDFNSFVCSLCQNWSDSKNFSIALASDLT